MVFDLLDYTIDSTRFISVSYLLGNISLIPRIRDLVTTSLVRLLGILTPRISVIGRSGPVGFMRFFLRCILRPAYLPLNITPVWPLLRLTKNTPGIILRLPLFTSTVTPLAVCLALNLYRGMGLPLPTTLPVSVRRSAFT